MPRALTHAAFAAPGSPIRPCDFVGLSENAWDFDAGQHPRLEAIGDSEGLRRLVPLTQGPARPRRSRWSVANRRRVTAQIEPDPGASDLATAGLIGRSQMLASPCCHTRDDAAPQYQNRKLKPVMRHPAAMAAHYPVKAPCHSLLLTHRRMGRYVFFAIIQFPLRLRDDARRDSMKRPCCRWGERACAPDRNFTAVGFELGGVPAERVVASRRRRRRRTAAARLQRHASGDVDEVIPRPGMRCSALLSCADAACWRGSPNCAATQSRLASPMRSGGRPAAQCGAWSANISISSSGWAR